MKKTIQTSETFFSFQGEKSVGYPQVWIRTTKCNFECRGFGNPENKDTTLISTIGFDPKDYKTLESMPIITAGCDSSYSWSPLFEHTWTTWTFDDLAQNLLDTIPHHSFVHPKTHQRVGLAITGGEPTLKLRELSEFLFHPKLHELQTVTFETNCSVPIREAQIIRLNQWLDVNPNNQIVWSNSPKLSNSGEKWSDAIKPSVAMRQRELHPGRFQQYFKFVSDGSDKSFDEIERAMEAYHNAGVPLETEVWIMPEGATLEQQNGVDARICDAAMARGYNVAPRVHVYVYGNQVGT